MTRVGILLSGCGRYDGTDVHEAVLVALALDRQGARVEYFAPPDARLETVDHATGQLVEGESRSVLVESARIARGQVRPIGEARAALLSALVIPGGQGAVRTLMRGASEWKRRREVDPEVAQLVRECLERGRPVGVVSLAGSLLSTVLGLPLEEDPFSTPASDIKIDAERGIVWTPGFMTDDRPAEIAKGIDRMVEEVLRRAARGLNVLG